MSEDLLIQQEVAGSDKTEEELLIEEPETEVVEADKTEPAEVQESDEPDYDKELDRIRANITKKEEVKAEDKTEDNLLSDKDSATEKVDKPAGKTDDLVTINETYIKSQPEEHQAILRSVLGKRKEAKADAKLLKNHIQAELHIQELKSGKEQPSKSAEPTEASTFQPENTDEASISKAANEYLVTMLKAKYPSVTENDLKDEDSIEEYIAEMQTHSPLKAKKFIDDYQKASGTVQQRKEQFTYLAKNWEQIDRATVVDAVKKFDGWLKKAGVNASDLGIQYTEKFILDNFITPNNQPDSSVVVYADKEGQIPIVMGNSLLRKMKEHYEDLVFDKVKSVGRIEGIESRSKMEPPGSISGGDHRERGEREKPVETQIRDDMTSEEMDAVLAKIKKRIHDQKGV